MYFLMRFPNGLKKALTLSYDDGVRQDKRLADIIYKNGIKCTFNINSGLFEKTRSTAEEKGRMTIEEALALYKSIPCEVSTHGVNHTFLNLMPKSALMGEIFDDRKNLEELFGGIIRGMAYPYGTFSDEVIEHLKKADIVYARTTIPTLNFSIPDNWFKLNPTCHHNHPKMPELTEKFLTETPVHESWLFYLWGHSYEFDKDDNWEVIEEFSKKTGNQSDIWYATNIEIYDYVTAYNSIYTTADGKTLYNPSAIDLWVDNGDEIKKLEAGKSVVF